MTSQELTADQSHQRNILAMGKELGDIYSQLWQELAWLYSIWAEYVTLFGTKESRVILLNDAAPTFTRIIQDSLWEAVILNIARLTDPPKSMGKPNLSIQSLKEAVIDSNLKAQITIAVEKALFASDFCRDWRNRHLAHRNLELSLNRGAKPLEQASRLKVMKSLKSLSEVLNLISQRYLKTTTLFDIDLQVGGRIDGAMSLLYYIDLGIEAEKNKLERLESGTWDSIDQKREL